MPRPPLLLTGKDKLTINNNTNSMIMVRISIKTNNNSHQNQGNNKTNKHYYNDHTMHPGLYVNRYIDASKELNMK